MLATIVDTTALWKITAVGFGFGVGGVLVWTLAIIAEARFETARSDGATASSAAYAVLGGLAVLICLGAIVAGLIAMTHK